MQHASKTCSTFSEEYFISIPIKKLLKMHIITVDNNSAFPKDLRGLHCIRTFICLADVFTLGNFSVIILWHCLCLLSKPYDFCFRGRSFVTLGTDWFLNLWECVLRFKEKRVHPQMKICWIKNVAPSTQ